MCPPVPPVVRMMAGTGYIIQQVMAGLRPPSASGGSCNWVRLDYFHHFLQWVKWWLGLDVSCGGYCLFLGPITGLRVSQLGAFLRSPEFTKCSPVLASVTLAPALRSCRRTRGNGIGCGLSPSRPGSSTIHIILCARCRLWILTSRLPASLRVNSSGCSRVSPSFEDIRHLQGAVFSHPNG